MSDKLLANGEQRSSIARNLRWGLGWGLVGAALLAGFVLIQFLVGGLRNQELGIAAILLTYAITGLIGGLILGALRPIAGRRSGAVAIAFLIAIPFAITLRFAKWGFGPWTRTDTIAVLLTASSLGLVGGLTLHHQLSDDASDE